MGKKRVLFILKRREDYNGFIHSKIGLSTGLYNSANFMNEMLQKNGVESKLVVVIDNNDIDREVHNYRPTHVIIEALWVVPSKFVILSQLHPQVKWIIRLHSEMPFLANEGIAMDWLGDYAAFSNIIIGVNTPRALNEVRNYLQFLKQWDEKTTNERVIYLPNYYPQDYKTKKFDKKKDTIDISCFGAVRPLKNHLEQALGAIEFANAIGKKLRFHINSTRMENKGEPVFHNLKGLFAHTCDLGHTLVNHDWTPREEFIQLCGQMDIGMQVSFSETFNIVSADHISQGVPVVGSDEIPWLFKPFAAEPTKSDDIKNKLMYTYKFPNLNVLMNKKLLKSYTSKTEKIWIQYFKS
jgi:hypothetical protein